MMTGSIQRDFLFLLITAVTVHGQTVGVSPEDVSVSLPGGIAEFFCIPMLPSGNTVTSVTWTANSTSLRETLSPAAMPLVEMHEAGNIRILTLSNLPWHYHNTIIRCAVTLNTGHRVQSYNSATLMLLLMIDLTTMPVTMEQANTEPPTTEMATTEQATTEMATMEMGTTEQGITEMAATEVAITSEPPITVLVTDPEVKPNSITTIITGMGAAVGILIVAAITTLLVVLCGKRICTLKTKMTQSQPSPIEEAIMYEEIGEVVKETFMFTRNVLYGVSSKPTCEEEAREGKEGVAVSEVNQARSHEYEDVDVPTRIGRIKEIKVSSSSASEAYQMEECSAYGANISLT